MWFCVSLTFERVHPETNRDEPLWEQSLILVDALSEGHAAIRGAALGKAREISFDAISGENVQWRFVRVGEIFEISDALPKEGSEVFSRFLSCDPE
jgi:hypothetical protein